MKKNSTLFFLILLFSIQSFAQSITLLPSYGRQTVFSDVLGSSPVLKSSRQSISSSYSDIKVFLNNKKGRGFYIGLATNNYGFSIKGYPAVNSESTISTLRKRNSFEFGYRLSFKPIYLDKIVQTSKDKSGSGFFFQLEPMVGFGVNPIGHENLHNGAIGSGNMSISNLYESGGNYSFHTGGNIYFGNHKHQLFFISVMKNWNFAGNTTTAILNTQYNGSSYQQRVVSKGNGISFSVGLPIIIGWGKKDKK